MTATVLEFWLSSLDMRGYHQAFLDNGYDDLEICKKVRRNDDDDDDDDVDGVDVDRGE